MNHANFAGNAQKGQEIFDGSADNTVFTNGDHISEILDDWDDNKIVGRDAVTVTATGFTDRFGKTFRPAWTTEAGTPTVVAGSLRLDNGDHVSIASSFNTGTWQFDGYMTTGAVGWLAFYVFSDIAAYQVNESGYRLHCGWQWNDFRFSRLDNGAVITLIDVEASLHNAFRNCKITRDGVGNWEIFYEGGSKGTILDNTHTTANYLHIYSSNPNTDRVDNLEVY